MTLSENTETAIEQILEIASRAVGSGGAPVIRLEAELNRFLDDTANDGPALFRSVLKVCERRGIVTRNAFGEFESHTQSSASNTSTEADEDDGEGRSTGAPQGAEGHLPASSSTTSRTKKTKKAKKVRRGGSASVVSGAMKTVAKAYAAIFERQLHNGLAVGEVWWSAIPNVVNGYEEDAAILRACRDYAVPAEDMQIRDYVPAEVMEAIIAKAEADARARSSNA